MSIAYYLKKKYPKNNVIVNDYNKNIIDFYSILKTDNEKLLHIIKSLNTKENIVNYNNLLNIFNITNNKILKSALFYVLNKIAFNSNIYYNKDGKLNITLNKKFNNKTINLKEDNFKNFLNSIELNNINVLD